MGIPSPGYKQTGEFENLFHLKQFWGAISLASLKVDLALILRLEGTGAAGSRRCSFAGTASPASLGPSRPALRPGFLSLRGCDASPAASGLRGISGMFPFEFYFLLKISLLMSLFLALLALRCCLDSSCRDQGLLSGCGVQASHRGGLLRGLCTLGCGEVLQ